MAERVETGGVMRFDYRGEKVSKLDDGKKKEIEDAYGQYYERKKRERRNKIIFWIIVALIVVGVGVYFVLR